MFAPLLCALCVSVVNLHFNNRDTESTEQSMEKPLTRSLTQEMHRDMVLACRGFVGPWSNCRLGGPLLHLPQVHAIHGAGPAGNAPLCRALRLAAAGRGIGPVTHDPKPHAARLLSEGPYADAPRRHPVRPGVRFETLGLRALLRVSARKWL